MKKASKILAIAHFAILLLLIFWNYYANTGIIDGKSVGSVSAKYTSLFTPAGYTFSIWGIIYLALIYMGIYMLRSAFSNTMEDEFILRAAPWLIVAHLLNGSWLWFWLNEDIGISVILISLLFGSLMIAVFRLNMEKWDASVKFIAGVWWPIDIYVGWLAVAMIANISAYLSALGWDGGLTEVSWTIIMLVVATAVNLLMIITRNMREFAVVGIWALVGIAVRHWGEIVEIQYTALSGAIILFIAVNIHAYQNRATLPFMPKNRK